MKLKHCLTAEVSEMSADTKIAELLTELHQLIKQTQVSYLFTGINPFLYPFNTWAVCRRRGRAVNTTCSTFRRHMRGCRRKTKVSHHLEKTFPHLLTVMRRWISSLAGDRSHVPLSPAASPYYRTKLRGLYTTAKADAEAECRWAFTRFLCRWVNTGQSRWREPWTKMMMTKQVFVCALCLSCPPASCDTLWIKLQRSSRCWRRGE